MNENKKEKPIEEKKSNFDKYIKPVLQYIGVIGATLMSVAYVLIVVILITGFKQNEMKGDLIFALVNAFVGLIIMQFLKIQGISFAKNLPENKQVIDEYYATRTKDKKAHSIKFYWAKSIVLDVITKAIIIAATTFGLVYIVIQGSNDYMLLLLAGINLIMFICFGLLSLNSAYDFFCNSHIPYIKEKINEVKQNKIEEKEIKQCLQSMGQNIGI